MLARVAEVAEGWLSKQSVFPDLEPFDVRHQVRAFYDAYLAGPFRTPVGGSRLNKLLWLALLAKALRPTLIVDSGTFTGGSAWAMSLGAPDTKLLSFDIDLSRLRLRQPNCEYFECDWSKPDLANFDLSRSLCFFDDHIDQVKRVLEAKQRNISFAIFDDDLPITCFASMAPSLAQLPKLEFVDDPLLEHGDLVEWTWNGAPRRWIVDKDYLAKGRAAIKAADRVPDFGSITGIRQLGFKVVAL
jgi:hypothetical protein